MAQTKVGPPHPAVQEAKARGLDIFANNDSTRSSQKRDEQNFCGQSDILQHRERQVTLPKLRVPPPALDHKFLFGNHA